MLSRKDLNLDELEFECPDHLGSANTWGSNRKRPRQGPLRDGTNPRGHACSLVVGQTLRRSLIFQWVDQWTKIQKDRNVQCNTENYVPLVVPGQSTVSSSSSASASLASLPQDTSDDSSSSPTITRRRSANIPASGNLQKPQNDNLKKDTGTGTGKQVVRFARVVGGIHGKSQRRNGVSIKGHTRKHFSRFRFGTSYKSGIEEAQYLCSLPEQHKFRNVQEDENDKGSLQKTHLWCSTSCRKLWLDNSRSQCSKWRVWISIQQPICSRDTGFSQPFDTICSVWNQNFSGNEQDFTKVSRAVGEAESHLFRHFLELGKACEDLSWNHCSSARHRSETNGIAERAAGKIKRSFCCDVAIRLGWRMLGGFHEIFSYYCDRPVKTPSIW